jgi:hypothetical protein
MSTYRAHITLILFLGISSVAFAQFPRTDTTIVFTPSNPSLIRKDSYRPASNGWAMDIMMSNNGFALGGLYRHEFNDALSMNITLTISDVKDDAEFEQYDYYGQSFIPGKKNRLLMIPLMAGMEYRLFRDDITENFRPFVSAGMGPTMIYVSPYTYGPNDLDVWGFEQKMDFFTSLKYGQPHYSVGGYIGAGAYFGADRGSISGLSIRYYWVPFPDGIEVMDHGYIRNFGGLYITLTFGSMY